MDRPRLVTFSVLTTEVGSGASSPSRCRPDCCTLLKSSYNVCSWSHRSFPPRRCLDLSRSQTDQRSYLDIFSHIARLYSFGVMSRGWVGYQENTWARTTNANTFYYCAFSHQCPVCVCSEVTRRLDGGAEINFFVSVLLTSVLINGWLTCFYQGQYQYWLLVIKEKDNQYLDIYSKKYKSKRQSVE